MKVGSRPGPEACCRAAPRVEEALALLPFGSALQVIHPASPQARAIFDLGVVASMVLGLIFVVVAGVIAFALLRYRGRAGERDPRQDAGNRRLEIIWTAIPCAIVGVLFALTARTMGLSDPPPAPAPDLIVTGHQWWWEVRYPLSGVVTANEIHLGNRLHRLPVQQLLEKRRQLAGHPGVLRQIRVPVAAVRFEVAELEIVHLGIPLPAAIDDRTNI